MTTGRSEKEDKRKANRSFRRATRTNPEDAPKYVREVADVWSFANDGKQFVSPKHPYAWHLGHQFMRK